MVKEKWQIMWKQNKYSAIKEKVLLMYRQAGFALNLH